MRVLGLLLLTTLAAAPAAAVELVIPPTADGDPLVAGARATFAAVAENESEQEATRVILRQCVGQPEAIRFCYTDINMTKGEADTWLATRRIDGTRVGEQLGSNVTMRLLDGSRIYAPIGAEYVFQPIAEPAAETALPVLAAGAALLAAALGRRAR